MKIDIMTLFPDMCDTALSESVIGRARKAGVIQIACHNIRDYTLDRHKRVDDAPYGGGRGMILSAQPIYDCYMHICQQAETKPHLIYLSPKGRTLTQRRANALASYSHLVFLCGHYEGVDERVLEEIVDEEISIGDYILTGGELPALVLADAVCRLVPGVLSDASCFMEESHFNGLLEYPQYTRPEVWRGKEVPAVLRSGHHANILEWRRKTSLERTARCRPDLLEQAEDLTPADKIYLAGLQETAQKDRK